MMNEYTARKFQNGRNAKNQSDKKCDNLDYLRKQFIDSEFIILIKT